MKMMFVTKKFGKLLALAAALMLCAFVLAACGSQTKDADSGTKDAPVHEGSDSELDSVETVGGETPDVDPEMQIGSFSQTDSEFHTELLKLDAEDGEVLESPYYRMSSDDSGMACYEIRPAGSEDTVKVPVSSTVIYMANPDAGSDDSDSSEFDAYYECVTLSYEMNGEHIESEQYQLFVPNIYGQSASAATDGTATASPEAGE